MEAGETTIRRGQVADAAGIARVHVAAWRDTYAGVLPAAYLIGLSVEREGMRWRHRLGRPLSQTPTFVADDPGSGVVGYATCGASRWRLPVPIDGEVYELYVDPAAQGRHLGRRLVAAMAVWLLAEQMRSACVQVLQDNPARWFYRHMGGRLVLQRDTRFAGARLAQLTYAWPDIQSLDRLADPPDGTA